VNIGDDIDTFLTTTKCPFWYTELNLCFRQMIRTKIKIHKDENKSLYVQTFIFVLMNLWLSINDLHALYLYLVLIRLTLESRNANKNSVLQYPVTHARIRKYQNVHECSTYKTFQRMVCLLFIISLSSTY